MAPAARLGVVVWWILVSVLVVVCIGLADETPGLAIGLAILATPVMLRILVTMFRRPDKGRPMTAGQLAGTLAVSLFVVVPMGMAALVASFVVCGAILLSGVADAFATGPGLDGRVLGIAISVGVVAGALAAFAVYRDLRRRLKPRVD
jgi:hypothetical protein